jgi:hypothetical protein
MATNNPSPESSRIFNEFSPGKLILQARSTWRYTLSRWYKILGAGILFGLAGATYSYTKKPTYAAEITFALDEGMAQTAKTDYPGLVEELGLGTSLNAGGVFSSMTNIVELMRSRLLIEKTLKSSLQINGKTLNYADFFLDSLKYRDKWMKRSPYYHLNFLSAATDKKESLFASNILRNIYETLVAKNISIDRKGKGTTLISVKLISTHELFSKYFLEALMTEVTNYYIEIKTQRSKLNLDFIQKRTDSIRNAYNNALYGRAVFSDANINSIRLRATVPVEKQQTDITILKTSYVELVSALEAAKTSLMRDTPLIQYLDTPVLPLKMNRSGMIRYFIAFLIAGSFICAAFLLTKKIIKHLIRLEMTTSG